MRNLHSDLFMLAQQHGRIFFAVIDDGIMQAAEGRAGVHRNIFEFIPLDQIDNNVGLPATHAVISIAAHGYSSLIDFLYVQLEKKKARGSTRAFDFI
jgi:hypothetical protein